MPADTYESDPQDQAEVFDEDNTDENDVGPNAHEMKTFEEMADVYDVTQRAGDGLSAVRPLEEAEFTDGELDDEELEEDSYVAGGDTLTASSDDYGVEEVPATDDVELEAVADIENLRGAQGSAAHFESRGELDEEDLEELGYVDKTEED